MTVNFASVGRNRGAVRICFSQGVLDPIPAISYETTELTAKEMPLG